MAEKNRYPQIPSTVWWGVRSILQRTPNATVDKRLLGVRLGVQEVAARQYIAELKSVGMLTDEGKATALAQKWRLDETYTDAVKGLVAATYPEGLLHVAPPGDAERQKIVSWFLREGLGQGAAGNKAATYLLLSSPNPNEAPARSGQQAPRDGGGKRTTRARRAATQKDETPSAGIREDRAPKLARGEQRRARPSGLSSETFPLHVNVQIHISADAGSEQIESIFSAMRRYLYDAPNT
jgi:hypothetical protein